MVVKRHVMDTTSAEFHGQGWWVWGVFLGRQSVLAVPLVISRVWGLDAFHTFLGTLGHSFLRVHY